MCETNKLELGTDVAFEDMTEEEKVDFLSHCSDDYEEEYEEEKYPWIEEQMEWLRLIKDHIITSLSIEPSDLDLTPFDRRGGLAAFYDAFGDEYEKILMEMNKELVA